MAQKESDKVDRSSVAYVLGILSIVFAFVSPVAGIVFGIIGIIQSKKAGLKRIKTLNIVGLILAIIIFIASMVLVYFSTNNQLANLFPLV